jgi:hypothetical protein
VTLTAKATPGGDVRADVSASDLFATGLDFSVSGLSKDALANASAEAKFAIDAVGVTVESALSGGSDITATACVEIDTATALGAKATVSPATGGLSDWTLAAQRKDGPTTLSAVVTDGGNAITCGVASELDAKTTAGMQAKLQMGGERNALSFALGVAKSLSSGDIMRVVHSSGGDTDVTYTTSLCDGATATGCVRLAAKGHHYKTGIVVAMGK